MKTQKQLTQPIIITNDNILWAALHLKVGNYAIKKENYT